MNSLPLLPLHLQGICSKPLFHFITWFELTEFCVPYPALPCDRSHLLKVLKWYLCLDWIQLISRICLSSGHQTHTNYTGWIRQTECISHLPSWTELLGNNDKIIVISEYAPPPGQVLGCTKAFAYSGHLINTEWVISRILSEWVCRGA